ncbi:MAG TPA: tRNA uridine-5-carboxymethylaminomethyl(34) synthesis enzyme MnmG [Pyrinomonadaceae bacterium]|jgi:tRNA uridine 5-carboxymethylaminomethyl modification enzyme|nr:tRNA uridine-5-carboxymethylaminomethyl(34) synthesis enzyme MnmG [Pyrinomonadaceae bacterium]
MVFDESFDVVVIGAGHAGCEAASAAARLGARTGLVTLNLDLIGQMSCNPAIGGIGKGHLVREIDALGGIMGRVIDRTGIQFRLLNRSRGPAVRAPRAQADRTLYRLEMRRTLEATPNLSLRQGVVTSLIIEENCAVGIELQDTRRIAAKAIVIATGTFLNGQIHTGRRTYSGGRTGEPAAIEFAEALKRLGFRLGRLKTGTPPRLDGRTIDWDAFERQPPDERPVPFSFSTEQITQEQLDCYIGFTNERLHEAVRRNLHESPLYSGQITSVGPRYCPSIEDKVVKFPEKTRHQLFLEPEGYNTNEVYLNGFSTSLPAQLQQELVSLVPGFEAAQIIRPGYAIEYDFVDPKELTPFLETACIKGLFLAGQINGTTGYEEAACQGLIAGINAALSGTKRPLLRLDRQQAYIGVLIDDLISNGVDEPYRMFTSRSEHRLLLRHDNADSRLEPVGRELGLVGDEQWQEFNTKRARLASIRSILHGKKISRRDGEYQLIKTLTGQELGESISLAQLALRPYITPETIRDLLPAGVSDLPLADLESALADILYAGYLRAQTTTNQRLYQHDSLRVPEGFKFKRVASLSHEMVERLQRARPQTFGQARRIPGLTPAALSHLLVHLTAGQQEQRCFT